MNDKTKSCLTDFFKISMLASGTPAAYQNAISKDKTYKGNTCDCSPKEAIEEGMIRKPELDLIKGNMSTDFPMAIKAVLKREIDICSKEPFLPRILVNCLGRDEIKKLCDNPIVKNGIKKDFHVITIHSPKEYNDDNKKETIKSMVDGTEVDSQTAYEKIEGLDDNCFNDNLPVLVFQVRMIGEGINVKSFNSTIVTTHFDRTAMQQIGRAIRNYRIGQGPDKIKAGHANVYVFLENVNDIRNLILNLQDYNLTCECFDWGKEIDVATGSGENHNEDGTPDELNDFTWNNIPVEITELILASVDSKQGKCMQEAFAETLFSDYQDIVAEFMEAMKNDPEYFSEFGGNKPSGFNTAAFKKERSDHEKTENEQIEDSCSGKKTKKKKSSPQSEMTADIIIDHLIKLKYFLDTHRDSASEIWPVDRKLVLDEVFANKSVSDFFGRVIDDSFADKLAGTTGRCTEQAKTETTKNTIKTKENTECQEISVKKSIVAAQTPIPESTSVSSPSTSVETPRSGVWHWLTSLLRR